MPRRTDNYRLEYFKQGSYYSSRSDRRRFLTLDYNMESYVGIMGVGIISGWTIDSISGTKVQVLPGSGIIQGYYSESPYTVKRRSEMVDGDREVDVIPLQRGEPFPGYLSESEKTTYVSIIRLYDPSYNPVGSIEDYNVKVVVPMEFTLPNNADSYIFAVRDADQKPYPPLVDHPPPVGAPPDRSQYDNYNDYKVAYDAYREKINVVKEYRWWSNSDNHFTAIEFEDSRSNVYRSNRLLLGRVVVRGGEVVRVDTGDVNNLAQLESEITKIATQTLVEHRHGGSQSFDPPKINLKTNFRDTILAAVDQESGRAAYSILESVETSVELGHKHTYEMDEEGNGQTIGRNGSTNIHFHKIAEWVVGEPEESDEFVEPHIHTVDIDSEESVGNSESPYVVYVNGDKFGDETSTNVSVNFKKKNILFYEGISFSLNLYSVSFIFNYQGIAGAPKTETYSYSARKASILSFMIAMQKDFYNTYSKVFDLDTYLVKASGAVASQIFAFKASKGAALRQGSDPNAREYNDEYWVEDGVPHVEYLPQTTGKAYLYNTRVADPFAFFLEDDRDGTVSVAGLEDLISQSSAAQSLLKEEGDRFTFTPNAARNITVTLAEVGNIDEVTIEILGDVEVTGKLNPESILYLNANKVITGKFIPEVIPFISHVGRLEEECLPIQYPLVSIDGVRYDITPAITTVSLDHYHQLYLDNKWDGYTPNTMIGNKAVYYGEDSSGETYFIAHSHGVSDGNVSTQDASGLLNWVNNVSSETITSSEHNHALIIPAIGNSKTIYAIKEDVHGNIYAGTSDGFIIIPNSDTYQFVMNGVIIYSYGNDGLWNLLSSARSQYEAETGNPFFLTESVYHPQLEEVEPFLVNDGDSVLLKNSVEPDRQSDEVMIKKISHFKMPNFEYVEDKKLFEVLPFEEIIGYKYIKEDSTLAGGGVVLVETDADSDEIDFVTVRRDFNDTPVWSIEIKTSIEQGVSYVSSSANTDLLVVGSNLVTKSEGIDRGPYQPWGYTDVSSSIGVIRKVIKSYDGSYWLATNAGVYVSRPYMNGNSFVPVTIPSGNPNINGILEGESGFIYISSPSGIFKTLNGGRTWDKKFDVINGFSQIVRDYSLDKSTVENGHYHLFDVDIDGNGLLGESIGGGGLHVHQVNSWNISSTMSHVHSLVVVIYVVDNDRLIWRSVDNGENWKRYGAIPDGDVGELFAAFGKLFISKSDGLYSSSNGNSWSKLINDKIYSYEWNYNMDSFFLGSKNKLYSTYNGEDYVLAYSFDGYPSTILLEDGSRKYFGYAYSNQSRTFHFKDLTLPTGYFSAMVDFGIWLASEGSWEKDDSYDVYIDQKRILSTKYDEDKREIKGYSFDVLPSEGIIDFSASTSLTATLSIFDEVIKVESSYGFSVGDLISIGEDKDSIYAYISSVSGNSISMNTRASKSYDIGVKVVKVPSLNGDSSILISIYNSLLSNIGAFTHDGLEDALSNYSDGRPYKFNDSYLSNLLQLTQAVRYVYPDINSEFVNSLFYDFRYSESTVNQYIDVVTSNVYNQKFYDSSISIKGAKSINCILVGYGTFSGTVIVATDIGIFWSKLVPSLESNWFYINDVPFEVNSVSIFAGTRLLAATSDGTYYTEDMNSWTKVADPSMEFPSYIFDMRWNEDDNQIVTVPSHDALFVSDKVNNQGKITALSGTPYINLDINNTIKISGAGDKNGTYVIIGVSDGGTGQGSRIIVSPDFDGNNGNRYGIEIVMGAWWLQWDGDSNLSNPNITNTLLVGGENNIVYNNGGSDWSWRQAETPASNFITKNFLPLSVGNVLATAQGSSQYNQENYLFESTGIGQEWSIFRSFGEVRGDVISSEITDFNNTKISVNYTVPEDYVYLFGDLNQQDISIYEVGSDIASFSGYVVWNENRYEIDSIVIYGNEANELIISGGNYRFRVFPSKVNAMIETSLNTLFFGTNRGIYYDVNTIINRLTPSGTIVKAGFNGVVDSIDISGIIISLKTDVVNNNTVLSVKTDTPIRGDEIYGYKLYITDADPVEIFDIIESKSIAVGGESTIQIEVGTPLTNEYLGKRFRISGESSRINVNFDAPVETSQFNGGKLYISSDEYGNIGKSYDIIGNGKDFINIKESLIPSTTLVSRNANRVVDDSIQELTEEDELALLEGVNSQVSMDLQNGQSIRMVDSSGVLTLWVTMDRKVKQNSFRGLELELTVPDNDTSTNNIFDIKSNLTNAIGVSATEYGDVIAFRDGDPFIIRGSLFESLPGFSSLKTSVDSGHYHNVNVFGGFISGKISSFDSFDSSFVTFDVSDTRGFDDPLIQLRGDLLKDAQISFTSDNSPSSRYVSDVVSHTSTTITVNIKSSSYWSLGEESDIKISNGWNWEVDATNYGYTDGIVYNDFSVISQGITEDASRGSDEIKVLSSAGIVVGDKIVIQDDTLSEEINWVSQVVDGTTIKLSKSLSRTWFLTSNPQIKVLRDYFSNSHVHQIRSNEIDTISIDSYLDNGYPYTHSHRVLPLISDVSVLLKYENYVLCFGSGSIIYRTKDNGASWSIYADLNDYVEGVGEIDGVSSAIIYNGDIIAGANNGSLLAEVSVKSKAVKLEEPL